MIHARVPIGATMDTGTPVLGSRELLDAINGNNATVSDAATAGAATALPATPAGYLTITVNGSNFKMAYYLP